MALNGFTRNFKPLPALVFISNTALSSAMLFSSYIFSLYWDLFSKEWKNRDWIAGENQAERFIERAGLMEDADIIKTAIEGLPSYPVFTRKCHTDVSYLACARQLLASEKIYAQFATHNAHTLASVMNFAGTKKEFEFQRLHGMGEELYSEVIDPDKFDHPCRVYAPATRCQASYKL